MTNQPATILIVDDNVHNSKLFCTMLRSEGYLFRTAIDGMTALASVAEQIPDLILLDFMMPGMSGQEVAVKLRKNPITRNIPIIMVSAISEEELKKKCIEISVQDYLIKPLSRVTMSNKIRSLLNPDGILKAD